MKFHNEKLLATDGLQKTDKERGREWEREWENESMKLGGKRDRGRTMGDGEFSEN